MNPSTRAPDDPVLRVRDLGKSFTMHLRDGLRLPVLDGLSFDVAAGECLALTGPSGRGKSTLMKCLHGSYGIDRGEALFDHGAGTVDLATATPRRILALRRRELSYVSQFLRVVPRVSTLDVVAERLLDADPPTPAADDDARHAKRLEVARSEARALLARLQLPPALWDLPPATFSGGEQQRVNIARGFVVPARLLLLDEPTASLDAANRAIVVELIRAARRHGAAVVGIFHDETVRDAVATRTLALD